MFKKAFLVAFLSLRITSRDRLALFWFLLMPIIWTTLIGGIFGAGGGVEKIPIGLVSYDDSFCSQFFLETLKEDKDLKIEVFEEGEMKLLIKEGKLPLGVIVPSDFSQLLLKGEKASLEVLKSERSSAYFLEELVTRNIKRISANALTANFTLEKVEERRSLTKEEERGIWEKAFSEADGEWKPKPLIGVEYEALSPKEERPLIPTGASATSPGFSVMFVMMGVFFAASALVTERRDRTLARLLTTPTPKFSLMSGKMLGFFLQGNVQLLILILFGQLVLGVKWGSTPLGISLVGISFVLAAVGLGVFLSSLVKTTQQADAAAVLATMITGMLGGCWWPLEIAPPFMQTIGRFTPQYWAVNGFNKIITRGLGVVDVLPNVYILLAFAAISLLLSIGLFKFE